MSFVEDSPASKPAERQPFMARRVGLAGRDSGLWREMLRIIDQLQPRTCIVENPDSEWLASVQGDLEGAGYRVSRWPLAAADVGAPDIRGRVFLVADHHESGLAERRPARPSEVESLEWLAAQRDAWLSDLTGTWRVDDALPGRVDRRIRINAIGNAVVPDVAEWLGRRIIEADQVTR